MTITVSKRVRQYSSKEHGFEVTIGTAKPKDHVGLANREAKTTVVPSPLCIDEHALVHRQTSQIALSS